MSDKPFHIALTADFYDDQGNTKFADMGLELLSGSDRLSYQAFADHRPTIEADQLESVNGVIVLTPAVTATSIGEARDLLAIGRFGVGYDAVDISACTSRDVLVFITSGAVDHSVAEATVGWMLALTHHVRAKDELVRTGAWADRTGFMGCELRDRVFGAVGLGGIARRTIELLRSFGMKQPLAYDPFVDEATAKTVGVRLVELNTLLAEADFVSVHCPLTDQTRGLIDRSRIGRMKRSAYLLNTARGGIVDEDALFDALKDRRIAGAAMDCFVDEPITAPSRFRELDNVLLAPHSIAWTHELFRDIGRAVCQGMVDLSRGKRPRGVVNPKVLEQATFLEKWQRIIGKPVTP